jgi:hypothetical protein
MNGRLTAPIFRIQGITFLWLLLFAILVRPSLGGSTSQDVPPTPSECLSSYRQALRELQAAYRDVKIECVRLETLNVRERANAELRPVDRTTNYSYISSDKSRQLRLVREEPKYLDRVVSQADGNNFSIRRSTPNSSYFVERNNDREEGFKIFKDVDISLRGAVYCLPTISDFPEVVNSPEFTIPKVEKGRDSASSTLKIHFQFRPGNRKRPRISGWVSVDPNLGWVIRNCEYETQDLQLDNAPIFSNVGSVTYREDGKRAIPIDINYTTRIDGRTRSTVHYKISRFTFGETPRAEFALAAFGLGDIATVHESTRKRNDFSTVAFVLLAFGISAALWWAARVLRRKNSNRQ